MTVAVVTGAANGIGQAVAERLRDDGYLVVGLDLESVTAHGVVGIACDLAAIEGHDALVDRIEREHGPVTALANVAGISLPQPLADLSVEVYRRSLAVLLDGPIFLARAVGLRMAARGGGRIVNVSSIHATHSEVGSIAYDAAKAGLEAATRTLALELGPHGVLVNAVQPGFVRTRMSIHQGENELDGAAFRTVYLEGGKLPVRRAGEPHEIASSIAHLLSADNTYVTGATLVVDGGLTVAF